MSALMDVVREIVVGCPDLIVAALAGGMVSAGKLLSMNPSHWQPELRRAIELGPPGSHRDRLLALFEADPQLARRVYKCDMRMADAESIVKGRPPIGRG